MTNTWTYHYAQRNPGDTMQEENDRLYWVPEHGFAWLDSKIERLNKIAQKLGLPEVGYRVMQEELRDDPKDELKQQKILWKHIEMLGEAPRLKGYSFIARIMHSTEGNILKTVPGEELPIEFRNVEPRCQHCNLKRRRNDTFVLRKDETGELTQVGSNCLSDFLEHQSPDAYARFADYMSDLDAELQSMEDDDDGWGSEGGAGGGAGGGYEITSFLRTIYAYIKQFGWLGRGAARERSMSGENVMSSVDGALSLQQSRDTKSVEIYRDMMSGLNAEDDQMLTDALAWARGLKEGSEEEVNSLSDYYWNLTVACASPIVASKTEGIVASLPIAYDKAVLKKIQPGPTTVAGQKGQAVVLRGVLEYEEVARGENMYEVRTDDNKLVRWYGEPLTQNAGDPIFLQGVIVSYSKKFTATVTQLAQVKILDESAYLEESQKPQEQAEIGIDIPEYVEGEKVTTNVTVLKTKEVDSMYGTNTMFLLIDDTGTNLVYFSNAFKLNVGEKAKITATVKEVGEYNGQPSIKITRAKIISRELPEGAEDLCLDKDAEKQIKSQMRKLKKGIKTITDRTGFEDDNDLHPVANQIDQILMPAFRWARETLNESTDRQGLRHFVINPEQIAPAVERCLVAGQQQNEERKVQVQNNIQQHQQRLEEAQTKLNAFPAGSSEHNYDFRNTKWDVESAQRALETLTTIGDRSIVDYEKEIAEFMPAKDQKVQEAVQVAQGLQARFLDWENSKEELGVLKQELQELDDKLYRHKQDVKQYGPKSMLFAHSWLQRVAY